MSKTVKIIIILVAIAVISLYTYFYYIYTNIEWKLSGFDFDENSFSKEEAGDGFLDKANIIDKLGVKLNIQNNSSFAFSLTNFKLKVKNLERQEIGKIETIRRVSVPAKMMSEIEIQIDNVNELALLSDVLSGKLKGYKYTVSGLLGGFLPFRYTSKIL